MSNKCRLLTNEEMAYHLDIELPLQELEQLSDFDIDFSELLSALGGNDDE